ncbi:MAG TPA: endonuclease/exonuclease/phosphatase family protein [Candidatus Hydrogenedentes bacterium]|nr:endonuclease/exonuclease/phosphatase family protein [Candidatus Hydrogenedentota bacterium]HPG67803.1 endonuclease/exonuclease/phosphatase family protein [Candidatus Hydrogenedentota bacterium]
MPFYSQLNRIIEKPDERKRAVNNLISLREQLDVAVPPKDTEDNLLLATWNLRDFGKPLNKRRGWGPRLPETWFYIAEVISRFDFVAVQEVNELTEWKTVMGILGRHWDFIATDETDPDIGGNGERMTFVFDKRKVWFQGIAGEIVLPAQYLISKTELKVEKKKVVAGNQFKRTPFIASFQSGWLQFDICTVHLYYGDDSGSKLQERIAEIGTIAKYLSTRADRALGQDRALIVLGDFNIVSPEHDTMAALEGNGFQVPQALKQKPTTGTAKHYDQIGFKTKPEVIEYIETPSTNPREANAGVFPIFERVFAESQFDLYADTVKALSTAGQKADTAAKLRRAYRDWRTYQFSDHYPMWVRLQTDGSTAYLRRLADSL